MKYKMDGWMDGIASTSADKSEAAKWQQECVHNTQHDTWQGLQVPLTCSLSCNKRWEWCNKHFKGLSNKVYHAVQPQNEE
eukprot:m.366116 g.366116  ORF g.366116 m.366116 type:complete len:80 (+) comp34673_c0_seq1:125-364(+)